MAKAKREEDINFRAVVWSVAECEVREQQADALFRLLEPSGEFRRYVERLIDEKLAGTEGR